ncbi:MAG: hypothetical protein DRO67_00060 [Candidatus Asgardarchaeum californiense]|nr:MAG: hypothetical protein DRO67_00060 [Candidatus Asgardarchaeum californiense]
MYDFSKQYSVGRFHIPTRMMPSIERYVLKGIIPGDFLQGIICMDLFKAVSHADNENIENIPAYVYLFYNELPSACWGSKEAMYEWYEIGGMGWSKFSGREGCLKSKGESA